MSVYALDGTQITTPYNTNGTAINQCYDLNGHQLIIGQDYYENENGIKTNIKLTSLGNVKYKQSYCKYKGNYYVTDGSHVAEYDANFNLLRDVTLSIGHGNAFQLALGSDGIGFSSGWDDQKIYAVDLNTLTISYVIDLPTTGYTTCAVDDINKLIYIWQRDTRPNTNEKYNFIVYDYDTETILSTRKTTVSFGAMQGVDWIGENIIVLNGLGGANSVYNGYRIYTKSGDIVGEFVIGTKSAREPEGVFIDRQTGEMTINFDDKVIYRVDIQP